MVASGDPALFGVLSAPGRAAAPQMLAGTALAAAADQVRKVMGQARPAILALDLSYTATGVAWLDRTGYVGVTTFHTVPVADPDRWGTGLAARRRSLMERVFGMTGPGTLVVREERIQSKNVPGHSMLDLAALHGAVEDECERRALPLASINNQRVKVYGANTGHARKPQMVEAARREFGGLITIGGEDEADALWVLAIACHLHGLYLARKTRRRIEIAEAVRAGWPVFTPDMPRQILTRLRSAGHPTSPPEGRST